MCFNTDVVPGVNASEEDSADTVAKAEPTPIHMEDQKSAAIDADYGATSVKRGEGKFDADKELVVAMFDTQVEESASSKDDSVDGAVC
jgi:hypothetical protein